MEELQALYVKDNYQAPLAGLEGPCQQQGGGLANLAAIRAQIPHFE